jgi:hypothetical protein
LDEVTGKESFKIGTVESSVDCEVDFMVIHVVSLSFKFFASVA